MSFENEIRTMLNDCRDELCSAPEAYGAPVVARIEDAYDAALGFKAAIDHAREVVAKKQEAAKLANADEYQAAKNGEIRAMLLCRWLDGDDEYAEAEEDYRYNRDQYRKCMLHIERFKLLVELAKAG